MLLSSDYLLQRWPTLSSPVRPTNLFATNTYFYQIVNLYFQKLHRNSNGFISNCFMLQSWGSPLEHFDPPPFPHTSKRCQRFGPLSDQGVGGLPAGHGALHCGSRAPITPVTLSHLVPATSASISFPQKINPIVRKR